jgi:hypothetical protein
MPDQLIGICEIRADGYQCGQLSPYPVSNLTSFHLIVDPPEVTAVRGCPREQKLLGAITCHRDDFRVFGHRPYSGFVQAPPVDCVGAGTAPDNAIAQIRPGEGVASARTDRYIRNLDRLKISHSKMGRTNRGPLECTAGDAVADVRLTAVIRSRFVAIDLDGTVLGADDRLIGDVIVGLRHLRTHGLRVVLVTGRSVVALQALTWIDELFALCDHEVLVDEGDVVLDRRTGRVRCMAALPDAIVTRVTADCADIVMAAEGCLTATTRRAAVAYAHAYRIPRSLIQVGEPHGLVNRITVFGEPPPPIEGVAVDRIGPFSAAVLKNSYSGKAAGLACWLAGRFGEADLSRVIAIGDGDSDADMLSSSGIGVAVRDSSPVAIASASVHLDGPLGMFLLGFHLL